MHADGAQTREHDSYRQHPGICATGHTLMFQCSVRLDEPIYYTSVRYIISPYSILHGLRVRDLCSDQGVFDPLQGNLQRSQG